MIPIYTEISDLPQATVEEANTYHSERGNTSWTGDDNTKTQALQRAWDYIGILKWKSGIFDDSLVGVKAKLAAKNGQIILALEELKDPGVLSPGLTRDDYLASRDTAGVVKRSYMSNAPAYKKFRGFEMLVRPYVLSANTIELGRG